MANVLSPFGTGNIVLNKCTIDYGYNGIDLDRNTILVKNCTIRNILNNGYTTPTNNVTKYSLFFNNTNSGNRSMDRYGRKRIRSLFHCQQSITRVHH